MDVQVKRQKAGLAFIEEPATDRPLGAGGQTLKAGIQNLAVFLGFHQPVQMLNFLGKLQHLGNVEMAALFLGCIQHFLCICIIQGNGLFTDGIYTQGKAFHGHIMVQEGWGADIHHI